MCEGIVQCSYIQDYFSVLKWCIDLFHFQKYLNFGIEHSVSECFLAHFRHWGRTVALLLWAVLLALCVRGEQYLLGLSGMPGKCLLRNCKEVHVVFFLFSQFQRPLLRVVNTVRVCVTAYLSLSIPWERNVSKIVNMT